MNAVLMITHNNLELTKRAVTSVLAQDIGNLEFLVIDNGSTDGTLEWLESFPIQLIHNRDNVGYVEATNQGTNLLFLWGSDKVLWVANDVVLDPKTYRLMNEWPKGMITGMAVSEEDFTVPEVVDPAPGTCNFNVVLIRKWLWDAIGEHDPRFQNYASDLDYVIRMHELGITNQALYLNYYHFGSATLNLAPHDEHIQMCQSADRDREEFRKKYGFTCWSPEYLDRLADPHYRRQQ
jgi:GT2 family glycosyltransferase